MRTTVIARVTLLLLFVALTGCAAPSAAQPGEARALRVVATTDIVADVVSRVAGDRLMVALLVPQGSDIHSFQPSPRDVASVAEADLLVVNGLGLESFLQPVLDQTGGATTLVDLSVGLEPLAVGEHADEEHADEEHADEEHADEEHAGEEHGPYDPHVWLDPANVKQWTRTIAEALAELDPANAERYHENAAAYRSELDALDAMIRTEVETIPAERRLLVTDHATLGYFAERYGFEQLGTLVEGISSMAEPSAPALGALQRQIEAHDVPAIFVNVSVNQAIAAPLADDLGIEIVPLYAESLSLPDGPAATYLESMRYNTRAIAGALR